MRAATSAADVHIVPQFRPFVDLDYGDVYGHTSDDTARAAVDGLAGRLGL
jgi:hypothetical protein